MVAEACIDVDVKDLDGRRAKHADGLRRVIITSPMEIPEHNGHELDGGRRITVWNTGNSILSVGRVYSYHD